MNIFKLGRGELFGIIIPGAFLLLNILAFIPLSEFGIDTSTTIFDKKNSAVNITVFLILSYVTGFSLRLINPDLIERLTFYFRVPWLLCYSFIQARKKSVAYCPYLKFQLKIYRETFPYIDWFYNYYLKMSPYSLNQFYKKIYLQEFHKNKDLMTGRIFINQCKLYVRMKSIELNDELMFREGLVRFLSGMSCALLICAGIVIYHNPDKLIVFYIYIVMFFLFARKLRYIRFKEVGMILTAFAYSVTKSED